MAAYLVEHVETGAVQVVADRAGYEAPEWREVGRLSRQPREHEKIEGGRIVPDPAHGGRAEDARLRRLTPSERQAEAIAAATAAIEARLRANGVDLGKG